MRFKNPIYKVACADGEIFKARELAVAEGFIRNKYPKSKYYGKEDEIRQYGIDEHNGSLCADIIVEEEFS